MMAAKKAQKRRTKKRDTMPFTIHFDRADLEALQAIRERTGVPVAVLVRRAVRLTLNDNARAASAFESPTFLLDSDLKQLLE
jgi:hypothetical protein